MNFEDLNKFIENEMKRIDEYYDNKNKAELDMAYAIKLNEEMGELMNELLAHKGYQRKDKLANLKKEDLEKELSDVIICALLLAKKLNINVEESLQKKIEHLKNRSYK